MGDNAVDRSGAQSGPSPWRPPLGAASAWNSSTTTGFRNAPKVNPSAAGMFGMAVEQVKQHDNPELVSARLELRRLDNENNELRFQVRRLQADRDAVHTVLDELYDKFEDTKAELEDAQQQLATGSKEKISMKQTLDHSQKPQIESERELDLLEMDLLGENESVPMSERPRNKQMERMYAELEAKFLKQEELQKLTAERNLQHHKDGEQQIDKAQLAKDELENKSLNLEEDISQRLHAQFLKQMEDEIRVLQQKFEADMNTQREDSKNALLEQNKQRLEAIEQVEKLQVALQSARQEVTAAKTKDVTLSAQLSDFEELKKKLGKAEASHAAELAESRRLTQFFKGNSERSTREARNLKSKNKILAESVEAKEREIEDQLSHIYAIEAQMVEIQGQVPSAMPGGWR